jgi:hypothetical protein
MLNKLSEDCGGQDWIKSGLSNKLIREDVKPGTALCATKPTRAKSSV